MPGAGDPRGMRRQEIAPRDDAHHTTLVASRYDGEPPHTLHDHEVRRVTQRAVGERNRRRSPDDLGDAKIVGEARVEQIPPRDDADQAAFFVDDGEALMGRRRSRVTNSAAYAPPASAR